MFDVIAAKCLDCRRDRTDKVRLCEWDSCPLHPYRDEIAVAANIGEQKTRPVEVTYEEWEAVVSAVCAVWVCEQGYPCGLRDNAERVLSALGLRLKD